MTTGDVYEANWNRQTGGQADRRTDGKDHILSPADALNKKRFIALYISHYIVLKGHNITLMFHHLL